MATDNNLKLTPSGMRQSSSLTGMTSASPLDATAGIFTGDRDPKNINDDAIKTLNDLLESCRDGEYGFRECAEHTQADHIKTVLHQRAGDCQSAAAELYQLIVDLGGEPDEGGTVSEALHRGWVAVKGTLSGYSDYDMLDECERAEDVALGQYRKSLKQNLPLNVKAVVERQARGAQLNHDQIKALRDSHKASGS
jgi:uncharacterized protein (TIGR02284 family)